MKQTKEPITLYIYTKCSTCQKALNFLEGRKVAFIRKEITETPPSVTELKAMLQYVEGNIKKLFNTSGLLYKEMQLTEKLKEMTEANAVELLSQHGMLVKRPFLLGSDFGLTGFDETKWSQKL